MQYLYQDGDSAVFMDRDDYEQLSVPFTKLGEVRKFLQENCEAVVMLYNGEVIQVELQAFIVATVTVTDPGLKGDTASGATKPATLETGATVQVPLFIREGDKVRVDTRTGAYVERAGSN